MTASSTISLYPIVAVILLDNKNGSRILAKYYGSEYPGHSGTFVSATSSSVTSHGHQQQSIQQIDPQQLLATTKQQLAFEAQLYDRTRRYPDNEVAMLENGFITVYRSNLDVSFYIIGTASQNELLLATVLDAYFDVLAEAIKPQLDKKAILEAFDLAILALDEIVDRGLVLETDAKEVLGKIASAGGSSASRTGSGAGLGDLSGGINEQTISTAFQMAKEQMKTFLR